MRRTPGATGSSRPYSKAISRRNGISTAMAGSPQDGSRAMCCIPGPSCRASSARRNGQRRGRMKIKLDIDCTPEELRGFFGLPDVKPMQEQLLKEVEERLRGNPQALAAQAMLKT